MQNEQEVQKYLAERRKQAGREAVANYCGSRYSEASISRLKLRKERDFELISEWIHSKKGMLVYFGRPGCGKTHFCAALMNYIWHKYESARFLKENQFFGKLHKTIQENGDYIAEIKNMADVELIIFDDLGSCGSNDWRAETLFEFFDKRYSDNTPTVVTSNYNKEEISKMYHPRLASRIFDKNHAIIEGIDVDFRSSEFEEFKN